MNALPLKRSKFGNIKTEVDGVVFASKREAKRYGVLKLLERVGQIKDLTLQPAFDMIVNGVLVCTYIADFGYVEQGRRVIEDSKGYQTPEFRLKRKLLLACHGLEVVLT